VKAPLTGAELRRERTREWRKRELKEARENRGEQGAMEFWLRLTRTAIAKEAKAGRVDVWPAYALVSRLVLTAIQRRAAGDPRIWNDLLRYAEQVLERHPPHH